MLKLTKGNFLNIYFYMVVFMPLLPSIMNRSQLHVNIFFLLYSIVIILFFRERIIIKRMYYVIFYFSLTQVFLLLSYLYGSEGPSSLGDLISVFRPIMLCLFFMSIIILISGDEFEKINTITNGIVFVIIVCFFVSIIELIKPSFFYEIYLFFYKIKSKHDIENVAVTFFSLPYYTALFYNFSLIYLLVSKDEFKSRFRKYACILIVFLCILMAQSKTGVISAIVVCYFYWLFQLNNQRKVFYFILTALLLFFSYSIIINVIGYLNENYSGNLIRTTYDIIYNSEKSSTLQIRFEQFFTTVELISNNSIFYGIGIGRDVLLESWLVTIMYRYGLIGLFFIIISYLFIFIKSYVLFNKAKNKELLGYNYLMIMPLWMVSLFFTQLSVLSIEVSKGALINAIIMSFGICFYYKIKSKL